MKDFHQWLNERRNKGEPIPETRDQLMDIYKYERPEFLINREKKHKITYSKREYAQ